MASDDFGTDISWTASTTELGTVTGKDNMRQSIQNRISTTYDELNWVYTDYGCNYRNFLGMKSDDASLEFIKNSIKESLDNEARIDEYDLSVDYNGDGKVEVVITVDGESLEFTLD